MADAPPVVVGAGHALIECVEVLADLVREQAIPLTHLIDPRECRVVERRQTSDDDQALRIARKIITELLRREALRKAELADGAEFGEFAGGFARQFLHDVVGDVFVEGLKGIAPRKGGVRIVGVAIDLVPVVAREPDAALRVADRDFEFDADAGRFLDVAVDPQIHFALPLRQHADVAETAAPLDGLGEHLRHVVRFGAAHARRRDELIGIEVDHAVAEHIHAHVERRQRNRCGVWLGRAHGAGLAASQQQPAAQQQKQTYRHGITVACSGGIRPTVSRAAPDRFRAQRPRAADGRRCRCRPRPANGRPTAHVGARRSRLSRR